MFSALNQVQVGVKDPYRTSQYPVEGRIGIKNEKTEQVSPLHLTKQDYSLLGTFKLDRIHFPCLQSLLLIKYNKQMPAEIA